jgi:LysR family transcriptional regulator, low CO2-responsive transcriptional regulator
MYNITLRQLRSLKAIHETGKISAAAKVVGLTAPAVTLQLQQLEAEVRTSLFDRTPDGMWPTAAGLAVLDAARAIDERLRLLEDEVGAITTGKAGNLKLGVVSTAKYFAPRLIAAFLKEYPGVQVDLHVGNRASTIEALKSHALDTALMGRPPREVPVRSLMFGEHPFVVIAPADHPLASKRNIAKVDLAGERFLIREPGSGTRMLLEIFFADIPGKLEDLGAEMGSNETIKQAVMAGLGIAFISAHTIEQELQLRRLVILDVEGMPITRQWYGVSRMDRSTSPALQAFNTFLLREGASYLPTVGSKDDYGDRD